MGIMCLRCLSPWEALRFDRLARAILQKATESLFWVCLTLFNVCSALCQCAFACVCNVFMCFRSFDCFALYIFKLIKIDLTCSYSLAIDAIPYSEHIECIGCEASERGFDSRMGESEGI